MLGRGLASIPVLFGVDHLREVSVLHGLIPLTEMTLNLPANLAPTPAPRCQSRKTEPAPSPLCTCVSLVWNGMTETEYLPSLQALSPCPSLRPGHQP